MLKRNKLTWLMAFLLLVVAAACGDDSGAADSTKRQSADETDAAAESGGEPETTSLRVGLAAESTPFIGTIVAVEQGFFEAEGLDVEIVPFQGGPAALQALMAGEVEFTEQDFTPILSTYESAADVVVFNETVSFPSYSFYGSEGIKSWQDLVDANGVVGVSAIGGMDYILVRHVLESEGFDPDAVNYRAAGGPPDRARGVIAGQLNLVGAAPPGTYELDAAGLTRIGQLTDIMEAFPLEQYATMRTFQEENPNTVRAIRDAYEAAAEWMRDNPEATVDVLMKASGALEERRGDYEQALEEYLPYFAPAEPSREGYEFLTQFYVDDGIITSGSVDDVLDQVLFFDGD